MRATAKAAPRCTWRPFSTRTANGKLLLQAGADPTAENQRRARRAEHGAQGARRRTGRRVSLWILKGCKPGKPC
jgi:hypothetical protein